MKDISFSHGGGGPVDKCAIDSFQTTETVNGASTEMSFVSSPVLGDCEINFGFSAIQVTVSPVVTAGSGSIDPDGVQTADYGESIGFSLTPDPGYTVQGVGGTCSGSLSGNIFTAGPLLSATLKRVLN